MKLSQLVEISACLTLLRKAEINHKKLDSSQFIRCQKAERLLEVAIAVKSREEINRERETA